MSTNPIEEKYPSIVGQKSVLNKLNFFTEIQNKTGYWPFIAIFGQLGSGKTEIGRAVSNHLYGKNDKTKPKMAVEINVSSIKTLDDFFEIVNKYIVDKEVTIILDEFHCIKDVPGLQDALLTVFNTSKNGINTYYYNAIPYVFNSHLISWVLLSSEPQMLHHTLISRLEVIELEELSLNELSKIILKNLNGIKVSGDLLNEISTVTRNNGRESFKLADNIQKYLNNYNKKELSYEDWKSIKYQLGIRKNGISNLEYRIMKFLDKNNNGVSLTKLSSSLQLTSEATRDFERFLLANQYMEIVPAKGRLLTNFGRDYLKQE